MEKRTTQRILGTLVVIALVIILLPLFFGGNEPVTQTASVKAPPFPEPQTDVKPMPTDTLASTTSATAPVDTMAPASTPETHPQMAEAAKSIAKTDSVKDTVQQSAPAPKSMLASPKPTVMTQPIVSDKKPAVKNPPAPKTVIKHPITQEAKREVPKMVTAEKKVEKKTVVAHATPKTPAVKKVEKQMLAAAAPVAPKTETTPATQSEEVASNDNSFDIHQNETAAKPEHSHSQSLGWVVQMGYFKVKSNAIHMAEKLRSQGYRAFIYSEQTAKGERTHVYVGPEQKQAAVALAGKIQEKTKLSGVIVSYRPVA